MDFHSTCPFAATQPCHCGSRSREEIFFLHTNTLKNLFWIWVSIELNPHPSLPHRKVKYSCSIFQLLHEKTALWKPRSLSSIQQLSMHKADRTIISSRAWCLYFNCCSTQNAELCLETINIILWSWNLNNKTTSFPNQHICSFFALGCGRLPDI